MLLATHSLPSSAECVAVSVFGIKLVSHSTPLKINLQPTPIEGLTLLSFERKSSLGESRVERKSSLGESRVERKSSLGESRLETSSEGDAPGCVSVSGTVLLPRFRGIVYIALISFIGCLGGVTTHKKTRASTKHTGIFSRYEAVKETVKITPRYMCSSQAQGYTVRE